MKLTEEQKLFIVVHLAAYDRPSKIVKEFRDRFGVVIDRFQVANYDVEKRPRHINAKLRAIFQATRESYLKEVAVIPIFHRSVRLRRLQQIHDELLDKGNLIAAAQILEQAAKEAGEVFTNVTKVRGRLKHDHEGEVSFKADEDRAALADLIEQALRKTAPSDKETKH